jgi:hypothetical protein
LAAAARVVRQVAGQEQTMVVQAPQRSVHQRSPLVAPN